MEEFLEIMESCSVTWALHDIIEKGKRRLASKAE